MTNVQKKLQKIGSLASEISEELFQEEEERQGVHRKRDMSIEFAQHVREYYPRNPRYGFVMLIPTGDLIDHEGTHKAVSKQMRAFGWSYTGSAIKNEEGVEVAIKLVLKHPLDEE